MAPTDPDFSQITQSNADSAANSLATRIDALATDMQRSGNDVFSSVEGSTPDTALDDLSTIRQQLAGSATDYARIGTAMRTLKAAAEAWNRDAPKANEIQSASDELDSAKDAVSRAAAQVRSTDPGNPARIIALQAQSAADTRLREAVTKLADLKARRKAADESFQRESARAQNILNGVKPPAPGTVTSGKSLPSRTESGTKPFPTADEAGKGKAAGLDLASAGKPSPLLAGLSAEQWQERLKTFNPGDPLPDPRTPTGNKAIDALAHAASQQNTTYAWGGNRHTDGPSRGTTAGDPSGDAASHDDGRRTGYDCGGLVRYAVEQGAGVDVGRGTDAIDTSGHLEQVRGAVPSGDVAAYAHPGDVLVFGGSGPFSGSGTEHTGIYIGNGLMINAPGSGSPVQVDRIGHPGSTVDILEIP